ncbi:MAG: ABC transporter permease [Candidatus Nanopelagicales bacterium]
MIAFIIRRVLAGLVLLLAVSFLSFTLLNIAAGDVASQILGQNATQAQVDAKTIELGLDRNVIVRYFDWLLHAVQGDFGRSWYTTESVTQAIVNRLPVTISLVTLVMIVTTVVSFVIGAVAAIKRGTIDRVLQISTVIGNALPSFLVALVLVTLFAIQIKIFPATGYVPITESVGGWLWALVLPVIALSIQAIAGTAQQVRSSVIATLRQDYVRTLRSRGIPERRVLTRHVLRNASASPMTVLSLQFVSLLSGAVVVETIFALPGLGQMAVTYTARGDVPVVMGLVVYTVAIVVIVNLLVDIAVGWLNPKARVE